LSSSNKGKQTEHDNHENEEDFFQFLAGYIAPTLEGIRAKEESNLKQNTAGQQRELLKAFQQKFDAMYLHFLLFYGTLDEVEEGT
jgi:hypothetical protein